MRPKAREETASSVDRAHSEVLEGQGHKSKAILLVDADDDQRQALSRALVAEGYECAAFASGEEALETCDLTQIDAAVADVRLPGIDGVELGQRLKERSADEMFLPVILVGALDLPDDRIRGIRGGCDDVLGKPVNLFELTVRLDSLLTRREQRQQLVRANRSLTELQQKRRELASLVVHDLRNPLSAMQGNVMLLREGVDEATSEQILMDLETLTQKR